MKTKYYYPHQYCYAYVKDVGVVVIKAGENGYHKVNNVSRDLTEDQQKDYVNKRNGFDGVSKEEAEAMLVGSMFGWDVPGADPAYYKNKGFTITELLFAMAGFFFLSGVIYMAHLVCKALLKYIAS